MVRNRLVNFQPNATNITSNLVLNSKINIMKLYFYLSFWFCFLQLLVWLFASYMGIDAIILKIKSAGFYGNMFAENPHEEVAKIWHVSNQLASIINRGIAIIYFISLLTVVGSIFFIKKVGLNKITKLDFILSIVVIVILIGLPVDLFK